MNLSAMENIILFDPDDLKNYPREALEHGFLSLFFETFSKSSNNLLAKIKIATEQQNPEEFRNLMHALKGIAGNVKAKRLEEIANQCMHLENEVFGNKDKVQNILADLSECISQTNLALLEYLETYPDSKK